MAHVDQRIRSVLAGAAMVALLCVTAAPAWARGGGPLIQRAASCLATQPVCVEPGASPGLSQAEVTALRQRIQNEGAGPLYIAVLPPRATKEAGGSIDQLLRELAKDVNQNGTFVAVAANHLRAASTGSEGFSGGALATAAVQAHRTQGLDAILTNLVDRVASARGGTATGGGVNGSHSGGFGAAWLILIAAMVALFAFLQIRRRRFQASQERQQVEEVKQVAREDLRALGDDIRALDLDIEMPGVSRAAKQNYNDAVGLYDQANQEFERATRPQDLERVTAALEEGRFKMASAKAELEGRPVPERRLPCFFDPRHGPSVADVEWAPPGGAPRPVPACAACRQRVESGIEPDMRQVVVAGQPMPYWSAPAYYRPWAGGFFGGFGGGSFLGGLLLGDMLGGFGGWGGGWGDGDDYGGGGIGGGDFGGGFGGGGDFGGGFGGGDFGGGGDGGGSF